MQNIGESMFAVSILFFLWYTKRHKHEMLLMFAFFLFRRKTEATLFRKYPTWKCSKNAFRLLRNSINMTNPGEMYVSSWLWADQIIYRFICHFFELQATAEHWNMLIHITKCMSDVLHCTCMLVGKGYQSYKDLQT